MKLFIMMALLFCCTGAMAQKPVFKKLNEPNLHAGCYVEKGEDVIVNLAEEGMALFNFTGKDDTLQAIKKVKGYTEAYGNKKYKVYIKNRMVKKGEGCLEDHRYNIMVVYKGHSYYYTFKGFCGC